MSSLRRNRAATPAGLEQDVDDLAVRRKSVARIADEAVGHLAALAALRLRRYFALGACSLVPSERDAEWLLRLAAPSESTHTRDDRRLKVLERASFERSKQPHGSRVSTRICASNREHVRRKRVVRLILRPWKRAIAFR